MAGDSRGLLDARDDAHGPFSYFAVACIVPTIRLGKLASQVLPQGLSGAHLLKPATRRLLFQTRLRQFATALLRGKELMPLQVP